MQSCKGSHLRVRLRLVLLAYLAAFLLLLNFSAEPILAQSPTPTPPAPTSLTLGRVTVEQLNVRSQPSLLAPVIEQLQQDEVVQALGEKDGWIKIGPHKYVVSALVQPVKNQPVTPAEIADIVNKTTTGLRGSTSAKENSGKVGIGNLGFYGQISVPYTQVFSKPSFSAPTKNHRFYYSSIHRVIKVVINQAGQVWYQILDDRYPKRTQFIPARTLKKLTRDLLAPLYPEVSPQHKLVDVNLSTKILQLKVFDANAQVWTTLDQFVFSSGGVYLEAGKSGTATWVSYKTPPGTYFVLYKRLSRHMEGGTGSSYFNLPGVGFNTYFSWTGMALHATYWHNNWGTEHSHGCINLKPADALTVFRFTTPRTNVKDFLVPTALATVFTQDTNQPGTKIIIHY